MRAPRVGRARHTVEGEADALLRADLPDLLIERGGALRPKLPRAVLGTRHALRRHVGVELEGQPLDRDLARKPGLGEGALKPALADKAPGADHVGEDGDVHVCAPRLRPFTCVRAQDMP
jgi:hypothetical protein